MTINLLQKRVLGAGAFTSADLALLLGVARSKVSRYLRTYWDKRFGAAMGGDSYTWQAEENGAKTVNFYVLVELYLCFQLQEKGVNPRVILHARENIARETGAPYPFAQKSILTDGSKIYYELRDNIINADGTRQINLREIIHAFTERVVFSQDGMAEAFYPAGRDKRIVVNPHHQFGQPVFEGTNIRTQVLYDMYRSGETPEALSELYQLPQSQILDAIAFYQQAA